ncbi:MAG: CD1845 family protein [Peptococcaceae bacterium]|jgi:hypothetical protein|nr:CD1845 family protein [Peptococcaceae bacterium]
MRIVLKMLAAPTMCLLALTVAVCSFLLLVAGFVCCFLAVAACIGGVVLLLTSHPDGGIAFLIIAFLVSPYGLPALFARLVGWLNALRFSLKEFILG